MCIGCVHKVALKKYMNHRVTSKKRENEENLKQILTSQASFFFLISKNFIYTNGYSVQEKHKANPEKTRKNQTAKKNYKRERELRKEGRESFGGLGEGVFTDSFWWFGDQEDSAF